MVVVPGERRVLLYIGYMGKCRPTGYTCCLSSLTLEQDERPSFILYLEVNMTPEQGALYLIISIILDQAR